MVDIQANTDQLTEEVRNTLMEIDIFSQVRRTYTAVSITPEMAEIWLGKNTHNRNISETFVLRLAGAMLRGEWVDNAQPVKFDRNGNLLDGQHRLRAVIESGVTIVVDVAVGLDPRAQETMDTGRARRLADMLKLRGVTNSMLVGAAVNFLYLYDSNTVKMRGFHQWPTVQQGIEVYENNKEIETGAKMATRIAKRFRLAPAVCAALYYIFSRIDQEDADYFFEKMEQGTDLTENDPVLTLRRWLERESARPLQERHSREHQAAIMVKAWNAYREGTSPTMLNWAPGGKRNEPFPRAR